MSIKFQIDEICRFQWFNIFHYVFFYHHCGNRFLFFHRIHCVCDECRSGIVIVTVNIWLSTGLVVERLKFFNEIDWSIVFRNLLANQQKHSKLFIIQERKKKFDCGHSILWNSLSLSLTGIKIRKWILFNRDQLSKPYLFDEWIRDACIEIPKLNWLSLYQLSFEVISLKLH